MRLTRPPMDLDLDAFLQSQGDSTGEDSDGDGDHLRLAPRRTVDEILLDDSGSDSDSSLPSTSYPAPSYLDRPSFSSSNQSPPSPKERGNHHVPPTVSSRTLMTPNSRHSHSSASNFGSVDRGRPRDPSGDSSLSGPNVSRPLPPLFGGVRSNSKPGDALAAAAAASRSFLSAHAAAIKSRRASSRSSEDSSLKGQAAGSEVASDNGSCNLERSGSSGDIVNQIDSQMSHSIGKLTEDIAADSYHFQSSSERVEVSIVNSVQSNSVSEAEASGVQHLKESSPCKSGAIQVAQTSIDSKKGFNTSDQGIVDDSNKRSSENLAEKHTISSSIDDVNLLPKEVELLEAGAAIQAAAELKENSFPLPPLGFEDAEEDSGQLVEEIHDRGESPSYPTNGEVSPETSVRDSVTDTSIAEEVGLLWESVTEKKSQSVVKPLDLAEELEKKYAFTGLHLEEGAAAQPMRLDGVTKGSTVLGYFDIDINNTITRTLQTFRKDHGFPQVIATHLNFIAVGMSRGVILIVPSKYSLSQPNIMDSKIVILGVQGDRAHAPVTSMCFNPQGDLLFSGYGDGHITVWDVQKASIVKVINEHRAPVVHLLYLGQDPQGTRKFDIVSGDSKGVVKSLRFSVLPWINMISFSNSTPLLDGENTSTVICAAVLLPDENYYGFVTSSQKSSTVSSSGIGSMMGGVVGGDASRKFPEGSSLIEEGVIIFVTHHSALVAKVVIPDVKVYAQLPKPVGVRDGSMPYAAWKCMAPFQGNSSSEASERVSLLGIAWDRIVQVAKLVKSELRVCWKWTLESSAVGIAWLNDQMLVILTEPGKICLFERDGTVIHQTSFVVDESQGEDRVAYHTYLSNNTENPEKAYHNSVSVRGASIYILGKMHLVVSRLLPWKERIDVLRKSGDWMSALNMAIEIYDGQAHGIVDLPGKLDDVQKAIMPYLVELLLSYVDEVFSYMSVAFGSQIGNLGLLEEMNTTSSVHAEIKEQFTRAGGVAVEFCVHIKRTDILFDEILSRFVSVKQRETFLELLEPYILKDMLGSLPPEIMQALVEHYSKKGWLLRVEQCVLHMDISSLDFNQVVRLCREHRLYGALIYLFNNGLDDFKTPLEELLLVLRSGPRESVAPVGYRMLVYLKYCFQGLLFPPGHGVLPPARLSSLRMELVEFLLEDLGASNPVVNTSLPPLKVYPNMYYLLELDTEATLDVLRCAFVDDANSTTDYSLHDSSISNGEAAGINDVVCESKSMVQDTVNVLSNILQMDHLQADMPTGKDDTIKTWPSKMDLSYVFEFVSYYVACGRANVSKEILSLILDFLTSKTDLISSLVGENATLKTREKRVLALLEVVTEADWDSSYLLTLCEKTQFHLVCGFIHAIRSQYIAALDSYMKDVDEPIHAFVFIDGMLQQLRESELEKFKSAVICRIPDLIKLSREGTFFLILDHFSSESQQILLQLHSSPESLFLYLKTVIEVHSTGILSSCCLKRGDIGDFSNGRMAINQSRRIKKYLDRISDLPRFLRNNPIHLTDEIVELYVELLCRYECHAVLKFLETFESYRVVHCLHVCQKYGVVDAAAFLLERVGNVGSALSLTLSTLDEKFITLDAAVNSVIADKGEGCFEVLLRKDEVNSILNTVRACVSLCQRNSPQLDPNESESLWFQLLDSFCQPIKDSYHETEEAKQMGSLGESSDRQEEEEECKIKWKVSLSHKGNRILKKLFSVFIKEIVEGMIGYVRLPNIMSKLFSDNGGQEFGDFKLTILEMLGTYDFEKKILDTARSLIEDDTFYTMSLLRRGASHGYAPRGLLCCLCGSPLSKDSYDSRIRIFNCGHANHMQCEPQENEPSPKEGSAGCPICIPKNTQRTKSRFFFSDNGLVNRTSSKSQQSHGITVMHPHESDAFDNSYGLPSISRFEILTKLQKNHRSIHIENIPQLKLAPPAVYHEKVNKSIDLLNGESSSSASKVEKPSKSKRLKDIRVKGKAKQKQTTERHQSERKSQAKAND